MGYIFEREGFSRLIEELGGRYRLYAPVLKKGEGRYTDVDVVRYDFVEAFDEIELRKKSDYAFKEFLTPLSETLFFFTENEVKEADIEEKPVIIFLRSCDMHAVKRLDEMYLRNGADEDWFYKRRRNLVKFALIGCAEAFENCFCVDMKSNQTVDGYLFSVDEIDGKIHSDLKEEELKDIFKKNAGEEKPVTPQFVTETPIHVTIPEKIDKEIITDPLWDEYTSRCINCGRCNFVCPTCTCFTMQDVFYTDNGKAGERRRVGASCMVDGYTDVAGGGQYRRKNGERMRFKVLHKIFDFRRRFGYDMCVGCGRCDDVCPEYISYSNIINKVNAAVSQKTGKGEN